MPGSKDTRDLGWGVVQAYARERGHVRSACARGEFDRFLSERLQDVVSTSAGAATLSNVRVGRPPNTPTECRLGDSTYFAPVSATLSTRDGTRTVEAHLFDLPIMVGCEACLTYGAAAEDLVAMGECPYDQGGYFIVDGVERAVAFAQVPAHDASFLNRDGSFSALGGRVKIVVDRTGVATVSFRPRRFPGPPNSAAVALRSFGAATDADLTELVASCSTNLTANEIAALLRPALLGAASRGPVRAEVSGNFFADACASLPGDGVAEKRATLALALASAFEALSGKANWKSVDRRDSLEALEFKGPGVQMEWWVREEWDSHAASALVNAGDSVESIASALHHGDMVFRLSHRLRNNEEAFPSYDVPRLTPHGATAYVSRVVNVVHAQNTLRSPHNVHPSQFGFLCPVETPDGKQVGLVKQLANMADISPFPSPGDRSAVVEAVASSRAFESADVASSTSRTPPEDRVPVVVDGEVVGFTTDPARTVRALRDRRRAGAISRSVSVAWTYREPVRVSSSQGRLTRPLLTSDGTDRLRGGRLAGEGWESLLLSPKRGGGGDGDGDDLGDQPGGTAARSDVPSVEIVDARECSSLLVSQYADEDPETGCTHAEVHHTAFLSAIASFLPFSQHNPAPRNTFGSKLGKSCASVYASNFRKRRDNGSHLLHGGQLPIVDSAWSGLHGARALPYGVNVIAAISTVMGYNVEDAVVLNGSSLDRGLFASTYISTVEIIRGKGDTFCDPSSREVEPQFESYAHITPSGLPAVGSVLGENYPIVGRVTRRGVDVVDSSVRTGRSHAGTVMRADIIHGTDKITRAKVTVFSERRPQMGDKFASRSGQKGVCGQVLREQDMPCTASGLRPDIIVNPHAFPSRMTCAQFFESALAKATCFDGVVVDATPMSLPSTEDVAAKLAPFGHRWGSELMIDPRTGRSQECEVCIGPTFYMRLKQMVEDKIQASNGARRDKATGQPVGDGLRVGEMERDVILAHGMSSFLHESFTVRSDGSKLPVTYVDGVPEVPCAGTDVTPLRSANIDDSDVVTAKPPRAFTVLQAELRTMGISAAPVIPKGDEVDAKLPLNGPGVGYAPCSANAVPTEEDNGL